MKLNELLEEVKKIVGKQEAEYILSKVLIKDRASLYLDFNQEISKEQILEILEIADIRVEESIPLQYIFKNVDFYGRVFKVNTSVLIPRMESELLVEHVLNASKEFANPKILEIGTGSGALAISLALEGLDVLASDISEKALDVAKQNVEKHRVKLDFIHSDLFSNIEGVFDIIFSNPPYVSEQEYALLSKDIKFEPKIALVAQDNGLFFYKEIVKNIEKYLFRDGYLIFEIGHKQGRSVAHILKQKFEKVVIRKDYSGKDRIVIASSLKS